MEHIVITHLENGYVLLQPEQGYTLLCSVDNKTYTEAKVKEKDAKLFSAIPQE